VTEYTVTSVARYHIIRLPVEFTPKLRLLYLGSVDPVGGVYVRLKRVEVMRPEIHVN
jgi:hypothetical protein